MTTQRRNFARTPRKDKVWANIHDFDTGHPFSNAGVTMLQDILQAYKGDVAVATMQRATVMRIIGRLDLGNGPAATSDGALVACHWGIAWVTDQITQAAPLDAQIPDPANAGTQEAQWIQRGVLYGRVAAGVNTTYEARGQRGATAYLDVSQMRKAPTADYQLVLIVRGSSVAGTDMTMWINTSTMLALP